MSLETPSRARKLQEALHAKAKASPQLRFYSLYDKVYRKDVLALAWQQCARNGGAAGVDRVTFAAIEAYGKERWLGELAEELKKKRYQPGAVRRVFIPKPNGKMRPLGIPTIKDRVVQTATALVVGPIFEADLPEEQYAYRPNRGALDAVRHVHRLVNTGHTEVVDADLSGYFDSIPHAELLKCVARRIRDGAILHLIKLWLHAPVLEEDEQGQARPPPSGAGPGRGTPQGAPISPLLANLYMRRFILGWKVLGYADRLEARIVNYADDFVICCRDTGRAAMEAMRRLIERLKLTVNETKTKCVRVGAESFDFLGYTIGRCYSVKTGKHYLGTRPSRKAIRSLRDEIHAITRRSMTGKSVEELVARLNPKLIGWANYFCLGPVDMAYRALDRYVSERLRKWWCTKHGKRGQGRSRLLPPQLLAAWGVVRLPALARHLPWAKA
jgi:group II intron reverse transcriptase/maturase